jgi:predicted nucleic acid-binding protein
VGLAILDASVLIATIDAGHSHHQHALSELESRQQRQTLVLPAVAFSEALVFPYRVGSTQGRAVERGLRRLGRVEAITESIASRAARVRAARPIKLPDALILATALELSAEVILTFDRRWAAFDPRVRVLG